MIKGNFTISNLNFKSTMSPSLTSTLNGNGTNTLTVANVQNRVNISADKFETDKKTNKIMVTVLSVGAALCAVAAGFNDGKSIIKKREWIAGAIGASLGAIIIAIFAPKKEKYDLSDNQKLNGVV